MLTGNQVSAALLAKGARAQRTIGFAGGHLCEETCRRLLNRVKRWHREAAHFGCIAALGGSCAARAPVGRPCVVSPASSGPVHQGAPESAGLRRSSACWKLNRVGVRSRSLNDDHHACADADVVEAVGAAAAADLQALSVYSQS